MIRGSHGFDLCNYQGAALGFKGFHQTFNQGSIITGRDGIGGALFIENTAFGTVDYLDIIDPQGTWGFNMDWQWSGGSQPDMVWYTIGLTGSTLMSLKLRSDGTMDILGPTGSVLRNTGSTSTGFTPGQWCTLELKAVFGTSGSVQLWKNGTLAATVSGVNFGAVNPDRMGFQMTGFGPPGLVIDNYLIWDGQSGDPFTGQYGRQRILSIEPVEDLQAGEWQPSTPGPSFAMVDDFDGTAGGSPDGDATYLKALGTGPDAVFEMATSPCQGLILSLIWNACLRPDPSTATPTVDLVFIPTLSTLVVGSKAVVAVGYLNTDAQPATIDYFTYQQPVPLNPNTGQGWGDTDIANAAFGVGAAASPDVRLTSFYLEKVIDLTGKPFDCGGGTYAF